VTITFDGTPKTDAALSVVSQLAAIPEYIQHGASFALELALHAVEVARIRDQVLANQHHGRGEVLPLSDRERAQRMLYLAGLADITTLDPFVRRVGAELRCPDLYYLLKDHNGGKDPRASHCADVWYETKDGVRYERRTADCIGGASWEGGWDRFQPDRFAHIYGGWINTDSMRMECRRVIGPKSPRRCFERRDVPALGGYVVYESGAGGHPIGHIGGTPMGAPAGWDPNDRASWDALEVVDVAARGTRRANQLTTGRGWFGKDAYFVVPVMKP
jgi:hypothetical protein